jgi:hypothetical protein
MVYNMDFVILFDIYTCLVYYDRRIEFFNFPIPDLASRYYSEPCRHLAALLPLDLAFALNFLSRPRNDAPYLGH